MSDWATPSLVGGMVARGDQAVAGSQEAEGVQEATVIQGPAEGICQPVPKHRHPQQKVTLEMHPRGRWTHPVLCDPEGGYFWGLQFRLQHRNNPQGSRLVTACRGGWLPPSGDPDETPETVDWLQPEEGSSETCQVWTLKWRSSWVGRSLRMTLVHGSAHPSPHLLIPMTGLCGRQSRL